MCTCQHGTFPEPISWTKKVPEDDAGIRILYSDGQNPFQYAVHRPHWVPEIIEQRAFFERHSTPSFDKELRKL